MGESRSALLAAFGPWLMASATPTLAADLPVRTNPDWLRKPSVEELQKVWPTAAARKGTDGAAKISCQVNVEGGLHDCTVVSENPPELGFGAAALALAPKFRMRPATLNGVPIEGGTVRIPINWKFSGAMTGLYIKVLNDIPWRKAPTADQLLESYPEKARKAFKSGRVVMTCTYLPMGRVRGCQSDFQEPEGFGFGRSAISLAQYFEGPPLGDKLKGEQIRTQIEITYPSENLSTGMRVGKPKWLALASPEDVVSSYPEDARTKGIGGRAILNCDVIEGGGLGGCSVVSEDPASLGFGAAALKIVSAFKMTLWSDEGLPTVGANIRVPIVFRMGDDAPPGDTSPTPVKPKP